MKRITWIFIICIILVFVSLLFVVRPRTQESIALSVALPSVSAQDALSASQAASAPRISAKKPAPKDDPLAALRKIPQASTFVSLLEETGVVSELSTDGTYTFFAPTNAAFAASPLGPLSAMSAAQKKRLAEYHIVPGKMMSVSAIKAGHMTMLSRDELNANVLGSALVSGNTHVTGTYPAPDGIIYLTDIVLQPPVVRPYPL